MNTWYSHYSLPNRVGIRIIAKDKDGNYTMADTKLIITAQPFLFRDSHFLLLLLEE